MKAAQVSEYGGSEVVKTSEISDPSPKQGQILVEVYAASLNPFDKKIRSGMYKDMMPMNFPYTPGGDFAGVVLEVGEGVTEFKAEDEVFGSAQVLSGGSGAFSQKASANTKNSALKPKNLDFLEAASLPLVGSSAIQALEEHINLKKGQKILIQGGAGGIGSIAIQLAKHIGAFVAATVSAEDTKFVQSLGVDQVIDYKSENFEEVIKDFDAVFDLVGGEVGEKSLKVLKKSGVLVSMVGAPEEAAKDFGVTAISQNTQTNSKHLERLKELVDQGVIKPQIDKVFPLDEVKEAFDYLEQSSPRGKVVLKI